MLRGSASQLVPCCPAAPRALTEAGAERCTGEVGDLTRGSTDSARGSPSIWTFIFRGLFGLLGEIGAFDELGLTLLLMLAVFRIRRASSSRRPWSSGGDGEGRLWRRDFWLFSSSAIDELHDSRVIDESLEAVRDSRERRPTDLPWLCKRSRSARRRPSCRSARAAQRALKIGPGASVFSGRAIF